MIGHDPMDTKARDKRIAGMLRSRAKKDGGSNAPRNLQDDLSKAIQNMPQGEREPLIRAFDVVRDYWHEASRLSGPEYVRLLKDLLDLGFPESAAAVFVICVDSIAEVGVNLLTTAMPSSSCVDLWLKQSKTPKKALLKSVSGSCDEYYPTAWCDWIVKKAPIKALLPFADCAVQGRKRAGHLPGASDLLVAILTRDRKFVLTGLLLKEIVHDPMRMKSLVTACSRAPRIGENYARGLGLQLATQDGAGNVQLVVGALEELMRGLDEAHSQFAAQFAAHIATTWRLAVGSGVQALAVAQEALLRVGIDALLSTQGDNNRDLWLASTTRAIAEKVLAGKGKVSPQGAVEIAFALRAAQTDANAFDALWSAAFNLGIREIGEPNTVEPFDPIVHEDMRGGLLRGDDARMIRCGWKLGEVVLMRGQVEPV